MTDYNNLPPQPPYQQAPQQPQQPQPPYQQSYQPAPAAPYAAAAAQPKKSHAWIVAIVIVAAILLITLFAIGSCTSALSSMGGKSSSSGVLSDAPANSVAVITLDGTIQYDGTACSPEGLKSLLDTAANDSNIKAVVLRVNSGGGTATAGEEMAAYLREFRADSGKPVVVSSASINASAAYEISLQADYIYTAQTTEIGAIGTIMESYDLSELLDKLGISIDSIASTASKDSSYGYRPLTDEERAYYQNMVNEINATFISNVADGRGLSVEQVNTLATGMPFTGTTAVTNGIADGIGTLEDAEAKAADLAGLSTYEAYPLEIESDSLASLASLLSKEDISIDDLSALLKENRENGTISQ